MIKTTNLTKYYGSVRAVNAINLEVGSGEILGLLGPNGAGKSTTMRMVTGYLQPSSGSISIDGRDIAEFPIESKRLIGYLPEFAPLYPEMIVHDYLNYVGRVRRLSKEKTRSEIARCVDLCGLRDMMHKPFSALSRGYKQRVGLAHAIIGDPKILILDEPTSGLDPNQIVEIRSLIRSIGKEKTVIFSTHVLSEAEATCDRVVIIHEGEIVADNTPRALKHSLRGAVALDITLEDANYESVESALSAVDGILEVSPIGDRADDDGELRVRVVCSDEARRAVYRRIKSEEWMILELNMERQSLEEAFRELTEHGETEGQIGGR